MVGLESEDKHLRLQLQSDEGLEMHLWVENFE